jgi:hypothetical protein
VRIQEVPQRHWDEFGAALAQFLATAPVMSRDHPASKHRIKQLLGDFEKMMTAGGNHALSM